MKGPFDNPRKAGVISDFIYCQITDNNCRCRSANMPFYQAKLLLCRFVTTKFLPKVEYAGKLNASVMRADCIIISSSYLT
jgi:hypothetical protein